MFEQVPKPNGAQSICIALATKCLCHSLLLASRYFAHADGDAWHTETEVADSHEDVKAIIGRVLGNRKAVGFTDLRYILAGTLRRAAALLGEPLESGAT